MLEPNLYTDLGLLSQNYLEIGLFGVLFLFTQCEHRDEHYVTPKTAKRIRICIKTVSVVINHSIPTINMIYYLPT